MTSRENTRLTGNPSTSTQPMHGASSNNKHGGDASAKGQGNNANEVSGPSTLTNQQLPGKLSPK